MPDYLGRCSDAHTRQLVSPVSRSKNVLLSICSLSISRPRHNSTPADQTLGLILSELYSQLDHYAVVLKYVNRSDCSSNTRFVEYREKTLKTQHTLHQNRLEYVSINIKMMFRQTHNPMKSGVTATVAPSHRVLARDLLTITFLH